MGMVCASTHREAVLLRGHHVLGAADAELAAAGGRREADAVNGEGVRRSCAREGGGEGQRRYSTP